MLVMLIILLSKHSKYTYTYEKINGADLNGSLFCGKSKKILKKLVDANQKLCYYYLERLFQ